MEHYPLMIPGAPATGGTLEVTAPFDGSLIAECETAREAEVEKALETAFSLYRDRTTWLSLPRRIEILEKAAEIMGSRHEELSVEAAREGGKPLVDSRVEVTRAIDGLKLCVEELRNEQGQVIPMGTSAASAQRLAVTRREPIGVVVAVSAFNHPLNLIVHQVAPAVATGCPVVVKPAEDTPLSCFRFVEILRQAGLPEQWCQAMVAADLNTAEKLVTDPRVGFFSFIGSARVGWMLRSKLAPGTRCALEHGGAAPLIIAQDADMTDTLAAILKGGFYHAGQVCVSVQRVFVPDEQARALAESLAAGADKLRIGDPTVETTDVGPLIRPGEVSRIHEWVQEAVSAGAELLCGGAPIGDRAYQCTVLLNPPADARVSTLEIFGPVVCVYGYAQLEEAIRQANDLPFAFQGAVFTRDMNTALEVFQGLDGSAIMVNDHTAFRVDGMPFAGLRQSGLGVGGIPYTMHDMSVEKMLVLKSPVL